MVNTRVSDLSAGGAFADTDLLYVVETTGVGGVKKTITQLKEYVQDLMNSTLVNGANIGIVYDDGAGTLTISYTGPAPPASTTDLPEGTNLYFTDERAQDAVGAMATDGSLVYVDGTPLLTRGALTGDVTAAQGSNATTIANDAVTNAKAADMATARFKGRVTAGTGDPEDLTGTQATTLLDPFTSALKGLAPASGGGTTNFLRADATWAVPSAGAGGTTREIQFNNAGALDGADLTIPSGELNLINFPPRTSVAATPTTGHAKIYTRALASRANFCQQAAHLGVDVPFHLQGVGAFPVQGSLSSLPNTTTAPLSDGVTLTTATTISVDFTSGSANRWLARPKKRFTSAAAAGSATGFRTNYTFGLRRSAAAGRGGFYLAYNAGHSTNTTGYQLFAGLAASTSLLGGDPSALINMVGIGYDAADLNSGNWFLMHNDGAGVATKIDLGATNAARAADQGFFVELFCPQGGAAIEYAIVNVNTGAAVASGSLAADLPSSGIDLALKCETRNGAIAVAATVVTGNWYFEGYDFA